MFHSEWKWWKVVLAAASCGVGCAESGDDPSTVKDFRVLAVQMDAPELMSASCELNLETLQAFSQPITMRALLVDPSHAESQVHYEVDACASAPNGLCAEPSERVRLAEGDAPLGELSFQIQPGAARLADGTPLLKRVQERDDYAGLGGLRMPLVMRVKSGADSVYAQKRMVFSCPLVDGMSANRLPTPPGLKLEGQHWGESTAPELRGKPESGFRFEPEAFQERQEHYVVPGLDLKPVSLAENWKISWHTTLGKFDPAETGGVDFGGNESRHWVQWMPPEEATEVQEVTFWAVVRDGRGGESWLVRRAKWSP